MSERTPDQSDALQGSAPRDARGWVSRGSSAGARGDLSSERWSYDQALERAPECFEAALDRALVLREPRSLAHVIDMHQLTKDPERMCGSGGVGALIQRSCP